MRQRLLSFIKHPVTITCGVMAVTLTVALLGVSYFAVRLFRDGEITLSLDPYTVSGDKAQEAVEKYLGISLEDARDFYYYYASGPGEWHMQMRFSLSPARLNEILAQSQLCFGVELTPNPTVYFVTPQMPLVNTAQTLTLMPAATMPTALPTLDYVWMTPPANRQYTGSHCSTEPAVYYDLRVDQSNPERWTVWIQGYRG